MLETPRLEQLENKSLDSAAARSHTFSPAEEVTVTALFPGFPPETMTFLADLKANNTRDWFAAHRPVYEHAFLAPAEAFTQAIAAPLEALAGRPVSAKIFRIHRDVRFSKDKSP